MHCVRATAIREAAAKLGDTTGYRIALRTGLNESTVSRILRGKAMPGVKTLMLISQAYGVPVDDLIEETVIEAAV